MNGEQLFDEAWAEANRLQIELGKARAEVERLRAIVSADFELRPIRDDRTQVLIEYQCTRERKGLQ